MGYVYGGIKRPTRKIENIEKKHEKQDVILEMIEGTYKQHLQIQFVNDKCDLLQNLAVGNKVGIEINLKGRLWTNAAGVETCFNTLEGWKIEGVTAVKKPMGNIEAAFQEEAIRMMAEEDDEFGGLPF